MGFTLLRKAATLAPLFATLVFSSACSEKLPEQSEEAEVKSINIFFSKDDEAGDTVGKAYSYSPDTGRVSEIARINDNDDAVTVLDTDEEAPGYEFAAFADGRTLKLIDYSKTTRRRITTLRTFSDDICGIYPVKTPSPDAYIATSKSYLKIIDSLAVNIALKGFGEADCSRSSDGYRLIKFNPNSDTPVSEDRPVPSSEVFGGYLLDPSYSAIDPITDEQLRGRAIWLGHNKDTSSLSAKTNRGETIFEIPFTYATSPVFVKQLTSELLLIQRNSDIHVLTALEFRTLLNSSDGAGSRNVFDAFFQVPLIQLNLSDESKLANYALKGDYLAIEDDSSIYRYEISKKAIETAYSKTNTLERTRFSVLSSGELIINEIYSSHQALVAMPIPSQPDSIPLIPTADEIDFRVADTSLLVSALNTSNILDQSISHSSWVSAEMKINAVDKLLNQTLFIFADSQFDEGLTLLLNSNESDPATGALVGPTVYKYASNELDGRFVFKEFGDDESTIKEITIASYGKLTDSISLTSNDILGANFSMNNSFGGFQVSSNTSVKSYFFNPSQLDENDTNRKPSLALLKQSEDLSNSLVANSYGTTIRQSEL